MYKIQFAILGLFFGLIGPWSTSLEAQQITFFTPNTPAKKAAWNKAARFHEQVQIPDSQGFHPNGKLANKVGLTQFPYNLLDNRSLIQDYYIKKFRCPFYPGSISRLGRSKEFYRNDMYFPNEVLSAGFTLFGNETRGTYRYVSYNELLERRKLLNDNGAGKTQEAGILTEIIDCFKQEIDDSIYAPKEVPPEYYANDYFCHPCNGAIIYNFSRQEDGRYKRLKNLDEKKMSLDQQADNLVMDICYISGLFGRQRDENVPIPRCKNL